MSGVEPLCIAERKKLDAVVQLAQPKYASEVRQLAENLDQFDFVPKSDSPGRTARSLNWAMCPTTAA